MSINKALIVCFVCALVSVLATWLMFRVRDPIEIPVTFSERLFPLVEVNIDGNPLLCEFKIKSKYPLYLPETVLAGVSKLEIGKGSWKNADGSEEQTDLFTLPSMKLGGLRLRRVVTVAKAADSLEPFGLFRWPLDKWDLLLDLPRHTVWGIKDKRGLHDLGFAPAKMERVECRIESKGIYFTSQSCLGLARTMVSTSCCNLVNAKLWDGKGHELPILETSICIGGRDFGNQTFLPYNLTEELEVDVVLGVDFLRDHVVYIDARNEYLYFGGRHASAHLRRAPLGIPVQFTRGGCPVISAEIDKQKLKLLLDLGSAREILLPKAWASPTRWRRLYEEGVSNFRGEVANASCHLLPECRLKGVSLKNLVLTMTEPVDTCVDIDVEERPDGLDEWDGSIGHPLLRRTKLLFDLPNSKV